MVYGENRKKQGVVFTALEAGKVVMRIILGVVCIIENLNCDLKDVFGEHNGVLVMLNCEQHHEICVSVAVQHQKADVITTKPFSLESVVFV